MLQQTSRWAPFWARACGRIKDLRGQSANFLPGLRILGRAQAALRAGDRNRRQCANVAVGKRLQLSCGLSDWDRYSVLAEAKFDCQSIPTPGLLTCICWGPWVHPLFCCLCFCKPASRSSFTGGARDNDISAGHIGRDGDFAGVQWAITSGTWSLEGKNGWRRPFLFLVRALDGKPTQGGCSGHIQGR